MSANTVESTQTADDIRGETQRKVLNRLRRANGQLNAIIGSMESGTDCRSVVLQLAAVAEAVKRAGFVVISSGMKDCLDADSDHKPDLTIEELEKLFLSLT
jgi:DNA-binding FrmR family transcriptional regulator